MKLTLNFVIATIAVFIVCFDLPIDANPIDTTGPNDSVEETAKLLIQVDEMIEKIAESQHLYINNEEVTTPAAEKIQEEERFSAILNDIKKIEEMIKEAIVKANSNRQYRLVLRLRPLLSYVNQIYRNMEQLRARVVAVATLSNLHSTVNDVLVQFADVVTSSSSLSTGILSKPNQNIRITSVNSNVPSSAATTATTSASNNSRTTNVPSNKDASTPLSITTTSTLNNDEKFFKNFLELE